MNLKLIWILASAIIVSASMASAGYHKNFVGPQACTECHTDEGRAWQKSNHFKVFKGLHRNKFAKKLAKKMGAKSVKKSKMCAQCHYTGVKAGKPKAGISCESCHGFAKKWVKIHNDYGGKSVKKASEPAAHKAKRISSAIAGGMIRPENIYDVASNCFQCHTVPNEKLVMTEIGGKSHAAGSDFELVSWSQGEVRHNFLNSSDGSNKAASTERKRVLYVAGRILDLEYGLRGVAEATKKNRYTVAMAKRSMRALKHVEKINAKLKDAAIGKIIAAAKGAKLKANNKAQIMKAVSAISKTAKKLLNGNSGKAWAGIDGLIPTSVKGAAVQ